ncbi:MAG: M48 family metalloprotease [Deltaproteobacteria bacterium]|nr:M48 family metalloprotease [Deltaproteobacteria bacterium]
MPPESYRLMFNNIIYFVVVLLIFNISYAETPPDDSLFYSLLMLFLSWAAFAAYCRHAFRSLLQKAHGGRLRDPGQLSGQYQRLNVRLSVLAIFLFALAAYLFHLKYWLNLIPGFQLFSVLQGGTAIALFLFYLCTIWFFGFPVYRITVESDIPKAVFIRSNLRFNLPILFPWLILSLVYDLLALSPWTAPGGFLNTLWGQLIFFVCFILLLMTVMPKAIQYWWGCRPLPSSGKGDALRAFLEEKGFRYRGLLRWPIFEGRMMTAGIMGIVPRYRYVLVTDALLEYLNVEELKAVLAHEMGHAKYKHLVFYILFFAGFMALSLGLSDLYLYLVYSQPFLIHLLSEGDPHSVTLFHLLMTIPMLVTLLVYFRYIMGFFMRNFERQADLYSAVIMGTPALTVSSLEKIALISGSIRDVPSWHHFSIRQRVDCLWRTLRNPGFIKRHNRFVLTSFLIYVSVISLLVYLLNFGPVKTHLTHSLIEKALVEQIRNEPSTVAPYLNLAMLYQEMGKDQESRRLYEQIIDMNPRHPVALNNLAWLLVTTPQDALRDIPRGLELAKRAVALEPSPGFLDTLAEAYYQNGQAAEAVKTIQRAMAKATDNRDYYQGQLEKFLGNPKSF